VVSAAGSIARDNVAGDYVSSTIGRDVPAREAIARQRQTAKFRNRRNEMQIPEFREKQVNESDTHELFGLRISNGCA
jgi:hypothetical protein